MISLNRREYEARINLVMDYIRLHTSDDLSLNVLAKVANFSPYHFHRIFKAIVGETLNDFTRRIRIEKASKMLVLNPRKTITEIAFECGFSSSATFSRSFREHFGASPTEWRSGGWKKFSKIHQKKSKKRKVKSNIRQDISLPAGDNIRVKRRKSKERRGKGAKVEVKELPTYHVAYMRHIGPYGPELLDFWQRFIRWARARDLIRPDTVILGVPHGSPQFTEPGKLLYDTCIIVPENFTPEEDINVMDIPGGKYALCLFRGTAGEHEKRFEELFLDWMPDSGYQPDDRHFFHRYRDLNFYNPATRILECEICIPVKPL
ncbi:MAG: GyrI-like domain-containing protein [Deltaproteobacteria bacterium]|nr:MAG: GyrI-like domain-containing protein [Deltaproteobacteria bacterium]